MHNQYYVCSIDWQNNGGYVNNMLVKSMKVKDQILHLSKMFKILWKYKIKLSLLKCTFGVGSNKLSGYIVNQLGIKVILEKI